VAKSSSNIPPGKLFVQICAEVYSTARKRPQKQRRKAMLFQPTDLQYIYIIFVPIGVYIGRNLGNKYTLGYKFTEEQLSKRGPRGPYKKRSQGGF
jgi:hypothetical protein